MDGGNKPWSMPMLIIAIVVSLGTGVYNAKPKLYEFKSGLWFFTFAALILTIIWYGNAVYCYKNESKQVKDLQPDAEKYREFQDTEIKKLHDQRIATQANGEYVGRHRSTNDKVN